MPTIAILGATGFLGSPIADLFEAKGWEVISYSRTQSANSGKQGILADLFEEESLKRALLISRPNVVLSTAWETEHGKFWTKDSNIDYRDATLRFAELSFQAGVETFVGLGTMSEYGISPGHCDADVTPLISNDIYSKSKIETGLELKKIGQTFGGKTHWARVFQAYGPNEKSERFVPGLITKLQNGTEFSIRTPNFEMDWIHTADVASAIAFMLEKRLNHFVDIGTGIGTTVKELSELICEEFDFDSNLLDYSGQILGHEKKAIVDKQSQLLSLGWRPTESLRNRIRSLR
jgi:dTDP-6-deoxy-L-talose 4-dehydrogenase (NAD+)